MIKKEVLSQMYSDIFDENKLMKTTNAEEVINFCKLLSMLTGVQTCNKYGYVYEYIHEVYLSALLLLERE